MFMRHFFTLYALIGLALTAALAGAAEPHGSSTAPLPGYVYGRVVKIADGDTLTLLTQANDQIRVRLAEIDTPERGQPYGRKSQETLSSLVWEKDIAVRVVDVDRYGRTVGRIFVGDTDVSAEMVRTGAAWVYRRYATDPDLFTIEDEARLAQRGVWGLSETERVPPWEWRRRN